MIESNVLELCQDLHGCWLVKCILKHGGCVDRDLIFNEVWQDRRSVITHCHGKYVMQDLLGMYALF